MIIAIDGPAASGKGTIGRKLAERYGLRYLDTGLLYRAVAKGLLERNLSLQSELEAVKIAEMLKLEELRLHPSAMVNYGSDAALIAAYPKVRAALLGVQRKFAAQSPGAVLDGRDIGTVICPAADVKIFVTATPETRAHRRFLELSANGQRVSEAEILADILRRDERDTKRAVAPLAPAPDAHLLDTTHFDIDAAFRAAIAIVEAARAK
jgi:cytidylate kinase